MMCTRLKACNVQTQLWQRLPREVLAGPDVPFPRLCSAVLRHHGPLCTEDSRVSPAGERRAFLPSEQIPEFQGAELAWLAHGYTPVLRAVPGSRSLEHIWDELVNVSLVV